MRSLTLALIPALALAACATTQPLSAADDVALGYSLVQAAASEVALLQADGLVSQADAAKDLKALDDAKAALDVAQAAVAAGTAPNATTLSTTLATLNALNTALVAILPAQPK